MFPVQVFGDDPTPKDSICFLDILSDPIPDKHYKKSEVQIHFHKCINAWQNKIRAG